MTSAIADEFDLVNFAEVLTLRWKMALESLKADQTLKTNFGEDFIKLYLQVRESEEEEAHQSYSAADHRQYLRVL